MSDLGRSPRRVKMRAPLGNLFQEDEAEEINMTPMLDVVFIMLIFFIVTASFVKESGIDVNRPEAATAVKKERANILVAISDTGEIWINKRQIDVRAVQANIERLKAENPQGSVVIQADKKSTTDTLIKVMDAARAAGVFDVSIAAQES
jgi:biopolymer transport protein ExbD